MMRTRTISVPYLQGATKIEDSMRTIIDIVAYLQGTGKIGSERIFQVPTPSALTRGLEVALSCQQNKTKDILHIHTKAAKMHQRYQSDRNDPTVP